eukprot:1665245-Pyramimonas_sp.AAC.1
MSPSMDRLSMTCMNIMIDDVWGAGAYTASEPGSGPRWPWTHHLDFAVGSANVPSTGFHLRTIRLEMIRSGCSRRITTAFSGEITSIAPVFKMLSISLLSEARNFSRLSGLRRFTLTSPDLPAANTQPSSRQALDHSAPTWLDGLAHAPSPSGRAQKYS